MGGWWNGGHGQKDVCSDGIPSVRKCVLLKGRSPKRQTSLVVQRALSQDRGAGGQIRTKWVRGDPKWQEHRKEPRVWWESRGRNKIWENDCSSTGQKESPLWLNLKWIRGKNGLQSSMTECSLVHGWWGQAEGGPVSEKGRALVQGRWWFLINND